MQIIRATKLWQQAGAYYVRIQVMSRQHNISPEQEFDQYDTPETKYILALSDDFPVATCRWYGCDDGIAEIGRVVVLPEYRNQGIGRSVIEHAEIWIHESGYKKIVVKSRDVAVPFYEKLGYVPDNDIKLENPPFCCIYMDKEI